jgi:hypothetical protein
MKAQLNKKQIFMVIAIGLFCVSLGNTLNHFGIIGDGLTGLIMGIGLGLEILAVIKAKKHQHCDLRLN